MGREKERHMMLDEPSETTCMCMSPIPYNELRDFYDTGICGRCNYLMEKDD